VITLSQNKPLGPGDLNILIRDANGALVDPINLTYSIFQVSTQIPTVGARAYEYDLIQPSGMKVSDPYTLQNLTLVSQPKQVPTRSSQGAYYINMTVPNWQGIYRIVWYIIEYPDGPENSRFEDFVVQEIDPTSNSWEAPSTIIAQKRVTTNKYAPAIMYVRELLSDTNPDRNYHFRPPTPSKVVAGYTSRSGYIWLDSTILSNLDMAIGFMNWYNPKNVTLYTLDTVPREWGMTAALEAASFCLTGESARWGAEEFSYSLNGVSLDINKQSLYQSLGDTYHQRFELMAEKVTACRPYSVGLRQQRWLLGALIPLLCVLPQVLHIFSSSVGC
jgi:hypothetical protein